VTDPISLAILGLWHVHATDYARSIHEHPGTRLAAVWDPDADRGRAGAAALGVEFADDLDVLLARADIDAVSVTTATAQHHDVITRAARAVTHIFTEKVLTPTVEEAEDVLRVAEENNVIVVVSLPRLSESTTIAIRDLIRHGKLGEVTYTRVRMAHNGWIDDWLPERFARKADAIGGALADLGCHPVYLTQAFLGARPSAVTARYARVTGREVEDNAVVTLDYPSGAIGVVEASFVTTPGAFTIEVRGTTGSVLFGFGNETLLVKGRNFDPDSWTPLELPEAEPMPFDQWLAHIRTGTVAHDNLAAALELTRLVSAANLAAERASTIDY
jgi:predicted dehydrogenase